MDDKNDQIIDIDDNDEIIDLEIGSDDDSNDNNKSSNISPTRPNISPKKDSSILQNLNTLPLNRNMLPKNNDTTTKDKLRNLNNKNRSLPPIGGSSFNNILNMANKQANEGPDDNAGGIKQSIDKLSGGPASSVIKSETDKIVKSEVTSQIGALFSKLPLKVKIIIIASIAALMLLFIIVFSVFISNSDNQNIGNDTVAYVTESMTEEELIKQLQYYGYCNNESSCKKKGIYKFIMKLKDTYDNYSQACQEYKNNQPCGVNINTALILETINYYQNSSDIFDSNNTDATEEDLSNNGLTLKNVFSKIVNSFKQQKRINNMLNDIDALALAQAEFVQEKCGGSSNYYYQISFDKYISYLNFGNSSTHPNYNGEARVIENDTCQGPQNDYIDTSYNGSNNSTSGDNQGKQIVEFALQFVGNPYVYGKTSLTEGTDCSGFTMRVLEHFGITIPRTSAEQLSRASEFGGVNIGTNIAAALPGDLILYKGHVAIYMGNDEIVHSSDPKTGITTRKNASYRTILGIVRYWK